MLKSPHAPPPAGRRRRRDLPVRLHRRLPPPDSCRRSSTASPTSSRARRPLLARLAPSFECVWCTGWEERAEEHLPRLLGLPGGWPHLRSRRPGARRALEARGDRRPRRPGPPVAWIDDAHDATCDAGRPTRPGPTLLVRTDPADGLTDEHVTTARVAGPLGSERQDWRPRAAGGSRSGSPAVPMPAETYRWRPSLDHVPGEVPLAVRRRERPARRRIGTSTWPPWRWPASVSATAAGTCGNTSGSCGAAAGRHSAATR